MTWPPKFRLSLTVDITPARRPAIASPISPCGSISFISRP
jgi:hypothetical protein